MTDEQQALSSHAGWEGRFAAIETNHLQLQRDISALTKDVATAIQSTENLIQSVRVVADNQTTNTRTNWGVVLTGFIVFVMIMGLVVYEPLGMVRDVLYGHLDDGHPTSVLNSIDVKNDNFEKRIEIDHVRIHALENRIDKLSVDQRGTLERLLGIERELYPNAKYRAGRPTGTRKDK